MALQHLILLVVAIIKKITKCSLFTATITNQKQMATSTMLESHGPHSSRHKQNRPKKRRTIAAGSQGCCSRRGGGALPYILPARGHRKYHGANPSKLPNNSPKFISASVRTNQQAGARSNRAYPRGGRRPMRGRRLNGDLKRM